MPHVVQQETTLAYLENQVAAALTLQSSHEYRHWLLLYARYLVNEGKVPGGLFILLGPAPSLSQYICPEASESGQKYSGINLCTLSSQSLMVTLEALVFGFPFSMVDPQTPISKPEL